MEIFFKKKGQFHYNQYQGNLNHMLKLEMEAIENSDSSSNKFQDFENFLWMFSIVLKP